LQFAGPIENVTTIWAQDLLADKAENIKGMVTVKGDTLTIPGDVIDRVGLAAGDAGDLSVPGLVLRLEGKDLPVAGDDYTPVTSPVTERGVGRVAAPSKGVDGYIGTASISKREDDYVVKASGADQMVLRQLEEGFCSGTFTVTWTMSSQASTSPNGFLVLSSDEDGLSSLCAGAWFGGNAISVFENDTAWEKKPKIKVPLNGTVLCKLEVNLDTRIAVLTVNGISMKLVFSEAVTSINYIGFGVEKTETLFSKPDIKQ
jgi:hypothetical protein